MGWSEIIALIVQYGPGAITLAETLWQKWSTGAPPTQADFDALKVLAAKTARSQMTDALNRAGIALDSPQAIALLALTPA